jgi:phosphomannomutase
VNAVLGGEGNGGVILPDLHYGRDALAGAAIVLQHLTNERRPLSALRAELPAYTISKNKTPIGNLDPDAVLQLMAERYQDHDIDVTDGLKINFADEWVHLRKSNTEPIIRIYSESGNPAQADALAQRFMEELREATVEI